MPKYLSIESLLENYHKNIYLVIFDIEVGGVSASEKKNETNKTASKKVRPCFLDIVDGFERYFSYTVRSHNRRRKLKNTFPTKQDESQK